MTTRSRKESRLSRRRQWAEARRLKQQQIDDYNSSLPYADDIAFITQPGRIIERERMNARAERAYEHGKVAAAHDERADNIERQLASSIYDDDPDAIERLQTRIVLREQSRVRIKTFNTTVRKLGQLTPAAFAILSDTEKRDYTSISKHAAFQLGPHGEFPSYALANLGQLIRNDRQRIERITRQREQIAARDTQPAPVVITYNANGTWATVTFRDKPDRDILRALGRHGAGFKWNGVNWQGPASKLPDEVRELANEI